MESFMEKSSAAFSNFLLSNSKVAKLAKDERMYHLLEHIGTKPNVFYHVKVRNEK